MPIGEVKWFDPNKRFGFVRTQEGQDVFLHGAVLPPDVTTLQRGQRLELDVGASHRGPQALRVKLLDPPPSLAEQQRKGQKRPTSKKRTPDELHALIEDMITLLDTRVQPVLRKGRYPDHKTAQHIAEIVHAVAGEFDH